MLCFLIILFVTALITFLIVYPFCEIHFRYKDLQLEVYIKHWLIRKTIRKDFSEEQGKSDKSANGGTSDKASYYSIRDKINELKDRIYNSDTGFDTDELKKIKKEVKSEFSSLYRLFKVFASKTRYKVHIPSLRIKIEYGTGNPANTGIIYGSVWNVAGIFYPLLTRYFHIAYPTLDITPDFYGKRFNAEIKSIIKVRPMHIINAAISVFKCFVLTYFKNNFNKGREKNVR